MTKRFVFNRLVLVDRNNKLAKIVTFLPGTNFITSPENSKGSFVGKSIIMRSLFHALGGDGKFDAGWDAGHSLFYVLDFSVSNRQFTMVRRGSFFRLFDSQHQTIASTVSLTELGDILARVIGYRILTKNETKDKYEGAPSSYYFLLSYLDQSMKEPGVFDQFSNLPSSMAVSCFSDIIYGNCGLDNEQYYENKAKLAFGRQKLSDLQKQRNAIRQVIHEIDCAKGSSPDYSSLERLKKEIEINRNRLEEAGQKLLMQKKRLLKAENEKYELDLLLDQLLEYSQKAADNSTFVLKTHHCPYCDSPISDTAHVFFEHAIQPSQAKTQIDETKEKIKQVQYQIAEIESSYRLAKEENDNLEKTVFGSNEDYKDILDKFGIEKIKAQVVNKAFSLDSDITSEKQIIGALEIHLKEAEILKKQVDAKFAKSFAGAIDFYQIPGMEVNSSIRADTRTFKNSGDNKGLLFELLWIRSLHQTQVESSIYKDRVILPLVLDDPVNGDLDSDIRSLILKIACASSIAGEQLLISAVGLEKDHSGQFVADSNVIELSNPRFHLLNPEDYLLADPLLSSLGY
jgi:hypothetical protein